MENDSKYNGLNLDERDELQKLLETRLEDLNDDDLRRYYALINQTVKASYKRVKRMVRGW